MITMTFSEALLELKRGRRVSREGWNGKGMWLILVAADEYEITMPIVPKGAEYPWAGLAPWIGMKTADSKLVPWLASQTDILANDWTHPDEE